MTTASKHINESAKIFLPGQRPIEPKALRFALRLLWVPGFRRLAKKLLLNQLPRCLEVDFSPGFRCLYGNITAHHVSFNDAFLQDYAEIVIGEGTGFSYDNFVLTASHDLENDFRTIIAAPVVLGKNVWITSRVIILGGAVIGDGSVIGAGSVVTGVIPPFVFAAGSPARPIRDLKPHEQSHWG